MEAVDRLVKDYPHDTETLALKATTLYVYGLSAEAAIWWNRCLDEDHDHAIAYRSLGGMAFQRGDHEEAVRLLSRAAEIAPNLPGVYREQARSYFELGMLPAAVAALEKEISLSPGESENYDLLGQVHLELKEYDKARDFYQKAVDLDSQDSTAYYGLGTAYLRLGQREKATQPMERFRSLQDEAAAADGQGRMAGRALWNGLTLLAETHDHVGRIYLERENVRKAVYSWQRAADVDPKDIFSREQLFNKNAHQGRSLEALELCQQLRKIDPGNAAYHLNAGFFLTRSRQFGAAEDALKKAIEVAPDQPQGYRFYVDLLLLQKDRLDDAVSTARTLVAMQPTAANYLVLYLACDKAGDSAGASEAIQRAEELDPNNPQVRKILASLRTKP